MAPVVLSALSPLQAYKMFWLQPQTSNITLFSGFSPTVKLSHHPCSYSRAVNIFSLLCCVCFSLFSVGMVISLALILGADEVLWVVIESCFLSKLPTLPPDRSEFGFATVSVHLSCLLSVQKFARILLGLLGCCIFQRVSFLFRTT